MGTGDKGGHRQPLVTAGRSRVVAGAALLVLVVAVVVLVPRIVPAWIEAGRNRIDGPPRAAVSARALALHRSLRIVDLHVDSLLWGRDLAHRSDRGHLDLPRMEQGNLALAVFSIVTKTPHGLNLERNDERSDDITLLSMAQGLPPRTWFSLTARTLYHAGRLRALAAEPKNRFRLIETRSQLQQFLAERALDNRLHAGIIAIEGAHALEAHMQAVDVLYRAGVRMVGLTHFFDNAVGGSAHGLQKGGLTEFGRRLLPELERRGMIVDLAHASLQLVDEVLEHATRPIMVSHGGVQATCPGPRNLDDARLRRIAARGGVLGIGLWPEAVCGRDVDHVVRAVRHAVAVMGEDHVALGSDFDGSVSVPFDVTGLDRLTGALQDAGFADTRIRKIMGENAITLLELGLPD